MALTSGHLGDIEYIAETTEGAGLPASGSLQVPSDSILSIELNPNPIVERHYTVSDYDAIDTSYHAREWTMSIEYKFQQMKTGGGDIHQLAKTLEYYATNRTSGQLATLALVYRTGEMYTLLKGAMINSLAYGVAINETISMSVELWGTGGSTNTAASNFPNYSSLVASPAIAETYDIFGGGAVTRSGAFVAGVKSGTFTINNHLERVPKIGSQDAGYVRAGHLDPTMSLQILGDAGGKNELDDLIAADETDIIFDTGTTASKSQKLTFTNPSYTGQPIVYKVDDTHMVIGADLQAEAVALAAYS